MSLQIPDDSRDTTGGAQHVPAGEGLVRWFSGDVYTIKASRESTGGSLGVVEAEVPPGSGPIAHAHADRRFRSPVALVDILSTSFRRDSS